MFSINDHVLVINKNNIEGIILKSGREASVVMTTKEIDFCDKTIVESTFICKNDNLKLISDKFNERKLRLCSV